ncbi:MAG: NADPH:quinone oxidoreductase family protein [Myxococcota bacterium]|nr:NADPH:quinone oxidoreductase family protein [Myxococcota bacterium]
MSIQANVIAIGDDPIQSIENHLKLVPMVKPRLSTEDDVLIQVACSAISWVDIMMMCGVYQHRPRLPYTPGLEYSGTILEIGSKAKQSGLQIGDRVFVDCFSTGPRTSGSYQQYGGFASYALAPVEAVHTVPPHFSFAQACNFLGNYETAYHALVHCGGLQRGETVLIHGASGGTGLAAVQIAKAIGAHVIATGRHEHKLHIVQEHGADDIVVLEKEGEQYRFRERVRTINQGRGVDVVYDGVAGGVIVESLRSLRFGGRYLVIGWASTPFIAKKQQRSNMIPSNLILMKGLKAIGCPAVISAQKDPRIREQRQRDLMMWVAEKKISPYCAKVYPIEQIQAAMKERWLGGIVGGVAVQISSK